MFLLYNCLSRLTMISSFQREFGILKLFLEVARRLIVFFTRNGGICLQFVSIIQTSNISKSDHFNNTGFKFVF